MYTHTHKHNEIFPKYIYTDIYVHTHTHTNTHTQSHTHTTDPASHTITHTHTLTQLLLGELHSLVDTGLGLLRQLWQGDARGVFDDGQLLLGREARLLRQQSGAPIGKSHISHYIEDTKSIYVHFKATVQTGRAGHLSGNTYQESQRVSALV